MKIGRQRPLTTHTPPNKQNTTHLYNRSASPTNPNIKLKLKIKPPNQLRNFKTSYTILQAHHDDKQQFKCQEIYKQKQKQKQNAGGLVKRSYLDGYGRCGSFCANHVGKDAKFKLEVDGDLFYYCAKCAVKLASQGFLVDKLSNLSQHPQLPPPMINPTHFHHQLQTSIQNHKHLLQKLCQMDHIYSSEYSKIQNFYLRLISQIEKIKEDHLVQLQQQWRRYLQIVRIQCGYLQDNMDQIGVMREVMDGNWGRSQGKQDRQVRVKFYQHKLKVFQHKIQQIQQFLLKIPITSEGALNQKSQKAQKYLLSIFEQSQPQNLLKYAQKEQQNSRPETIISMLPSQSRYELQIPKKQSQKLINPVKFMRMYWDNRESQIVQVNQANQVKVSYVQEKKKTAFRRLFGEDDQNQGQ